jgi:L-threonylcarbamoyladenylate synthase
MLIIDYKKKHHTKIIHACVAALSAGKIIAYPTDTSYGLAVDATNIKAIKKLYKVKGRDFNKPVHIIPPSIAYAKKITRWNKQAEKLAKFFFPGAITLVLPLSTNNLVLRTLSAKSGWLGIRMPKNQIDLDLAKYLSKPITTTSANVSGQKDCYSSADIIGQFKNKKYQPDIIINAGKLAKCKPSTVVKITGQKFEILRHGPITESQIRRPLK